ncbi:MAG: T9SS type A sorting domain-containing protein, partial [Chryseobacterium sp.]|nr:T9SS type A sorting domain-containing protein [Chryseobacterium sp.]
LLFASGLFVLTANLMSAQYLKTEAFPNTLGISNQGIVVGYDAQTGPWLTWNPDTGNVENIGGIAPGNGYGGVSVFSDDGKYISGTVSNGTGDGTIAEMGRYNTITKEWQHLGSSGIGSDPKSLSSGYYISGDGKTVVGLSYNSNGNKKAVGYAWNENKGAIELESTLVDRNARANVVSGNGAIIAGWQDIGGPWKSSVWKRKADGTYDKNIMLLINPNGNPNDQMNQLAEVRAISADGKWLGGKSDFAFPNAWIWSEETGVKDLGTLTTDVGTNAWVTALNNDGSIVIGYHITKASPWDPAVYRPFIWTQKDGMKDLNDFVNNTLGYDMGGDKIYVPNMISQNGKYITGWAFPANTADKLRAFRIELPDSFLATAQMPKAQNQIKVYPNPAVDFFQIESKENIQEVKIYDQTGQLINVSKTAADTYNVSALPKGVYIISVKTASATKTSKLIKK